MTKQESSDGCNYGWANRALIVSLIVMVCGSGVLGWRRYDRLEDNQTAIVSAQSDAARERERLAGSITVLNTNIEALNKNLERLERSP